MIAITCTACRRKLSVKEELIGKKVKCPGCGAVLAVPAAAGARPGQGESRTVPASPSPETPTLPPSRSSPASLATVSLGEKPDATVVVRPDPGHDPALTDFLAPPQAPDELGRLGKYRILKVLGHGGMGAVFLGEDGTLGRKVAIKVMLPHLAQSRSAQQRFLREAKTAATLEHDNIVPIFHVEEDRGAPYIVMPLLKGEPLSDRLDHGGQMPLAEILRVGRELAEGLSAAHAAGLIHRDVKPANVWLESPRDRVKILDFGLARASSDESGLTQQGVIVGTPAYMSPEQGRGEPVDARGDLFSLGVVLYRLCTGKLPFQGKDPVSTLLAVARDEPAAPSDLRPELPPELSGLVMKLLEKDLARRPASAAEVVRAIQALEQKLAGQPPTAEPGASRRRSSGAPAWRDERTVDLESGSGRRRRLVLIAAAALALCGMVAGGVYWFWPAAKGPDGGANNTPPTPERRTVNLLELLDLKKDATQGNWSVDASGLKAEEDGVAVVEFPYSPPEEYDFRIEFTYGRGRRQLNQFLARGDRSFSCVLGAGDGGGLFALEAVDGKPAELSPAAVRRAVMTMNERHVCVARIRRDWLAVELDGSELFRWKTDYSDLTLDHPAIQHWADARRNRTRLAVGTFMSQTVFHEAEVIEISGRGTFSRPDDPGVVAGNWKNAGTPFVPLFNGKDLAGWKVVGHPGWSVRDGVLVGESAGPHGWLMTEQDYADFELSLEYRQSAGGNSGVFLRAWPDGPIDGGKFMEIQLIDDAIVPDPRAQTGALFGVLAPDPRPKATVNEWHRLDIRLQGWQLQVTFDGQKILSTNLRDHKDRVTRFPGLAATKGRIGLQIYPGKIEFRNVRVRKLAGG
jgi:serine/threonine protein kinase